METRDQTYNGWTNYETWNVALWLGDEQERDRYWNDRAQEVYEGAEPKWDWQTKFSAATQQLADELKEQHEEDTPTVTGVYADLLNSALSEVDWSEIAEHYMDEVEKEVEGTKEEA